MIKKGPQNKGINQVGRELTDADNESSKEDLEFYKLFKLNFELLKDHLAPEVINKENEILKSLEGAEPTERLSPSSCQPKKQKKVHSREVYSALNDQENLKHGIAPILIPPKGNTTFAGLPPTIPADSGHDVDLDERQFFPFGFVTEERGELADRRPLSARQPEKPKNFHSMIRSRIEVYSPFFDQENEGHKGKYHKRTAPILVTPKTAKKEDFVVGSPPKATILPILLKTPKTLVPQLLKTPKTLVPQWRLDYLRKVGIPINLKMEIVDQDYVLKTTNLKGK